MSWSLKYFVKQTNLQNEKYMYIYEFRENPIYVFSNKMTLFSFIHILGKKPQFSIQTQWEWCFFNYCNYFAYNFAKVYNTLQQNYCLTTWTWKWCSRQFMFTLSFCMDIVDSFRSVSLQELQTTLYGGTIFSDESDGIQDLVYLKKREGCALLLRQTQIWLSIKIYLKFVLK